MTADLLTVRNLAVTFPGDGRPIQAVAHLSLSLQPGQILGLVGESGSGKSATALALMGLVAPPGQVTGAVIWQPPGRPAVDLLQLSAAAWTGYRGRDLGMVFQEPMSALNPVYACGFQLIEAIQRHHRLTRPAAEQRALQLLEEVQLLATGASQMPDARRLLARYPHQFSGGQVQRWVIAMALAGDPQLLIADEPTTALDVTVQASILALLRQICQQRKMALLLISHDLGVVAGLADRVGVMYQGALVESGPLAQVFGQPQHPYTQGLLHCRPQPQRRWRYLPTLEDYLNTNGHSRPAPVEVSTPAVQARAAALAQAPTLVAVDNLRVAYPVRGLWGQTERYAMALQGISFTIQAGETLGLVGESGCGKSTLARTLVGLVAPTQGQITFQGIDITRSRGRQRQQTRRQMQLVFQDPFSSLNPRLSVGEAIGEPLRVHQPQISARTRRQRVAELLERVGLDPRAAGRYPHEFSGGQRQRICIARALALQPRLVICDEAVSALDVSVQAQILNLLKQLQEDLGLTYLFISHDLGVVRFMSDRIMVMNRGIIEEIGPAELVYHQPQSTYTQQLIAAIPDLNLDNLHPPRPNLN
ncbi:MAG: ABC transporter ATP-binding protein [Gloeomargaritaceae cyanobacterium C42_A2020_066]|nr:ABC transporter ATP-binding protein [Gloeomargaritaceae cyanobacterium C42_A2020_066]